MALDFHKSTSFYEQIEDDIKSRITSGELRIGDRIDSQSELCKKYDVSLITVKRALSNLINEGILFSRVGKGTYVARKSKSVDFSLHKSIGLVLKDFQHPFFSLIVHSVEERAYEKGYNVLLSNSSGNIAKEENQISHFEKMGVDGLVIASMNYTYRPSDQIRRLHDKNIPYIMISYVQDADIYYVGSDHERGAYLATEHLIELGYKNIGYVNAEKDNLLGLLRKKGYEKALNDHDVKFDKKLVYNLRQSKDRFESGYQVGLRFKDFDPKPDALFFYTDLAALGFMQAITDLGYKVPQDVAIIGFDDIYGAKLAPVPLTTVRQNTERIGEIAVNSIINRIEGKGVSVRTILEPRLVVRSSCGYSLLRQSVENRKLNSMRM